MTRTIFLAAVIGLVAATGTCAQTLKAVKDRGALICGVSQGLAGFSNPDDKGNWTGFDVDFCRALAAAVLGDATKVKFSPLSAKDRFEPLKTGEIDVLSRNTTWTLSRDVSYGNFVGTTYYDGQGFMVRKALKVNSALELNGASICTQTGTTNELNLADYFRANNMKYEVIAFGTADEAMKSNQPEIRRLLGVEGNFGEQLGLTRDWVVRIVKQVGNYGEVFDRNLGAGSRLGITRGLNRLWTKGGIQYAPPVR